MTVYHIIISELGFSDMFKIRMGVFCHTCHLIFDGHNFLCGYATRCFVQQSMGFSRSFRKKDILFAESVITMLTLSQILILFKLIECINSISLSVALYKQLVPGSSCIRRDKTSFIPFQSIFLFHPAFFTTCVPLKTEHIYIRGTCNGFPKGMSSFILVDRNAAPLGKGRMFLFASFFYFFFLVGNVFSQQIM